MKRIMKSSLAGKFVLSILFIGVFCFPNPSNAQDYSRFKKVKKWKITFEIKDKGRYKIPADLQFQDIAMKGIVTNQFDSILRAKSLPLQPFITMDPLLLMIRALLSFDEAIEKLSDIDGETTRNLALKAKTYSVTDKDNYMKGNLLFDKKDPWEPLTWTGKGKIDCKIANTTTGIHFGSFVGGTENGEGTTKLNSDESYFSIDPESGTYDLYLVPGYGDNAGINIKITSHNKLMEDMYKQIAEQMDESAENIKELWSNLELAEEDKKPEYIDLFYGGNREQWSVDIESRKIQTKGMVITGIEQVDKYRLITWIIEPVD